MPPLVFKATYYIIITLVPAAHLQYLVLTTFDILPCRLDNKFCACMSSELSNGNDTEGVGTRIYGSISDDDVTIANLMHV